MKQKRILQLLYSDDTSIGNVRREISRSFSECELEITVAFLTGEQQTKLTSNERSIFLNFSRESVKHQHPKIFFQLYTFLKQENFDVILCHRAKTLTLVHKINKLLKVKQCIFIAHNFSEFKQFSRRLSLLLFSDYRWQYIGISKAISTHLKSLNNGCIAEQVFTIENAIDCKKTISQLRSKQDVKMMFSLPDDKFIFGSVGRITRSKGQYDLVQAFHQLHKIYPDSCLAIVGSGPDTDHIINYLHEHQLNDSVFMLGFVTDAYQYMTAFDAFILPSHKEGFGLVLIEAMAAKLPIIATDTGGIPDVLGPEGTLVPVSDITALALAMESYRKLEPKQLSQIAERLQQRLFARFDINNFQEKYRALVYSSNLSPSSENETASNVWQPILNANELNNFSTLWSLDTEWFEEPNIRRGGWSGVVRVPLTLANEKNINIFIKRQENHLSKTWCHPISGIPTFQKEYENLCLFHRYQIPTQELVYYASRVDKGDVQAILITQELADYFPLDKILPDNEANLIQNTQHRKSLLKAVARVVNKMHQHHMQHNSLYPKHIFAKPLGIGWDVKFIDLEKAKRRLFKNTAIVRDLSTLQRHTLGLTTKEQIYFFKAYVNESILSPKSKTLWYQIQNRILNKSK